MSRTDTTANSTDEQPATPETEEPRASEAERPETAQAQDAKPEAAESEEPDTAEGEKAAEESAKPEPAEDAETEKAEPAKPEKTAKKIVFGKPKGDGGDGEIRKAEAAKQAWWRTPAAKTPLRAVVAVVLVAAVVLAGLQWYQTYQTAQREETREQIQASAGDFGRALLSYDHTKLQDTRDRVLGLASDDFAKTYDEAFTGLESVITRLKANATATVRAVYVGEIEEGTAKAVAVMDSEVRSTAGTRRVLGQYLDMRLVKRGDVWRVAEVTSVGAADENMIDPRGNPQNPQTPEKDGDPAPQPGR